MCKVAEIMLKVVVYNWGPLPWECLAIHLFSVAVSLKDWATGLSLGVNTDEGKLHAEFAAEVQSSKCEPSGVSVSSSMFSESLA